MCWSHIDANGDEIDYCYMPLYEGCLVDEKLRSLSGRAPMSNKNRQQEVDCAKANNLTSDIIWYTGVACDWVLMQLLLVLTSRSTDTQNKFGAGNANTYASLGEGSIKLAGTLNDKGLFYGKQDQSTCVKVFGIENFWGNMWKALAGWVNDHGTQKIKMTYGQSDGSTVDGYNLDGAGYITIANATPSGTFGGYISSVRFTEFGIVPYRASGSATTYFTDGFWFDNGLNDYTLVGGASAGGLSCGLFCLSMHFAHSFKYWGVGTTLSCKPLAQTQTGGENV